MKLRNSITVLALISGALFAQDAVQTNTDSLKLELEKINKKLELYEHSEQVRAQAAADAALEASEKEEEEEVKTPREPGVGGGGGLSIGFKAIDMTPLKNSIAFDIKRKGTESEYYGLNIDEKIAGTYETFFMLGGQGLAGVGNGIRFGGGIYGGTRFYRLYDDNTDSVHTMVVWNGYGGFILEKAFSFNNANLVVGTLLGAGSQGSVLWNSDADNTWEYEYDEDNNIVDSTSLDDAAVDFATFFVGEIHTGLTYSFLPWLHLGMEFSGAFHVSGAGFKEGEQFTTFNPGGNLRIMFGRVS